VLCKKSAQNEGYLVKFWLSLAKDRYVITAISISTCCPMTLHKSKIGIFALPLLILLLRSIELQSQIYLPNLEKTRSLGMPNGGALPAQYLKRVRTWPDQEEAILTSNGGGPLGLRLIHRGDCEGCLWCGAASESRRKTWADRCK